MFKCNLVYLFTILALVISVQSKSYSQKFEHIKIAGKKLKTSDIADIGQKALSTVFPELAQLDVPGVPSGNTQSFDSPLMQKIYDYLQVNYQKIGHEQALPLLNHSKEYDWGQKNTSGMQWQLPMGAVGIGVNRQLIPDFSEENRYMVYDQFVIEVDAQSFLRQLEEKDLIKVRASTFGAFAGIKFRREYSVSHFEHGFVSALTGKLDLLFFPFLSMSINRLRKLGLYEQVKKSDSLVAHAGGFFRGPLWQGATLRTGILGKVDVKKEVAFQNWGEQGFIVNITKEQTKQLALEAQLEAEFFELLRVTLFSLKLNFNKKKGHTITLSVPAETLFNCEAKGKLKALVRKAEMSEYWRPFVLEENFSLSQRKEVDWKFLVFGGIKSSQTEHIRFQKDGSYKDLFRFHWESYDKNYGLGEVLKNSFLLKAFNLDDKLDARAIQSKTVRVEFQYEGESAPSLERIQYEARRPLAIVLQEKLEMKRILGGSRRNLRRRAADFLTLKTNLEHSTANLIKKKKVQGPLSLLSQIVLRKEHMETFFQHDPSNVFINFSSVCRSARARDWSQNWSKEIKYGQEGPDNCVKKLGKRYLELRRHYVNNKTFELGKLRRFFQAYLKNVSQYHVFHHLFGYKQFFHYGEMQAEGRDGTAFKQSFKTGRFRGFGLDSKDLD